MTKYQLAIVIPATGGSNRIRLSHAFIAAGAVLPGAVAAGLYSDSYLPCAKLLVQMMAGASGGRGFLGDVTVDDTGAGGAETIPAAASATVAGVEVVHESQDDKNDIDLSQFYIHGAHATDVMMVQYWQA